MASEDALILPHRANPCGCDFGNDRADICDSPSRAPSSRACGLRARLVALGELQDGQSGAVGNAGAAV
jgi:hypothetical protein